MTGTKYPIFKCLHRGEKGFTLVELLIVIAILGIIAAVAVPNIAKFTERGYIEAANAEIDSVNTACMSYYMETDTCPTDVAALVSGGHLSATPVNTYDISSGLCHVESGTAAGRFDGNISWNTTAKRWE